jgi:hypothetical protein
MTRDFYNSLAAEASAEERERRILALQPQGLLALLDYAMGCEGGESREEIMGIALVAAAERYLKRARKKHKKALRRAKQI